MSSPKNKMKFCRSVKFLAFRISNVIAFKSPKKSWKRGNRTKADTQSGKQNNLPKQQKKNNGKKCAKNRNKYLTECIFAFFSFWKAIEHAGGTSASYYIPEFCHTFIFCYLLSRFATLYKHYIHSNEDKIHTICHVFCHVFFHVTV